MNDGVEVIWEVMGERLRVGKQGLVMGVLNVTPDSFSDGGKWAATEEAVAHGTAMADAGAGVIDVGGESTRPGAAAVGEDEERRRVVPVITGLKKQLPERVLVSVDTSKAAVAAAALEAGADVINDVSGLAGDPAMLGVVAASGCGVVVMHMQGSPRTMQTEPDYGDVVAEVGEYLAECVAACGEAGIAAERVLVDPGIGFGKTLEHNLALLRGLREIAADAGRPVLLGVSRKSFIGTLLGSRELGDREWPTVALSSYAREMGCVGVRVHDVGPNTESLRMTEAVLDAG